MEIEFGKIEIDRPEEEKQVPKVKEILQKFFNKRKLKQFDDIFIANPHQCVSDDYEPERSNPRTLEVYFYSAPSSVGADIGRYAEVSLGGAKVAMQSGQSDSIVVSKIPKSFTLIEDESGNQLALAQSNKLWILNDLLHNIGESTSAASVVETLLNFVIDTYLDPPSPEEIRKRVLEKMNSIINDNFGKMKGQLESEVKTLASEVQTLETQIAERIRNLAYKSDMLEIANRREKPNGEEILRRIERMPYVKNINFKGGFLNVETNPISIGPFEYGEWKIALQPNEPRYQHPVSGKQRHAYEHNGGNFCMGGFANEYVLTVSAGNFDRALSLARLEITNYSTSTKMVNIEDYLRATMGPAKFDKLLKEIKEEKAPDADSLMISGVIGSKMTFVATKGIKDGRPVPTAERFEIDYAN